MYSLRKYKLLLNWFFLAVTILFIVVFFVWKTQGDLVFLAGEKFSRLYSVVYEHIYKNTIEDLKSGNVAAVVLKLESWEDVKKGDRIYPFKSMLINELLQKYHSTGRYSEQLKLSSKWAQLDSHNIIALAYQVDAQWHQSGQAVEDSEKLKLLWQRFPMNEESSKFYMEALSVYGDLSKQEEVESRYLKTALARGVRRWRAFIDDGNGFGADNSFFFPLENESSNSWHMQGEIPVDTRRLRIDPPRDSSIRFSISKFLVNGVHYQITLKDLEVEGLYQDGDSVETRHAMDPYFVIDVAPFLAGIGKGLVKVELHLSLVATMNIDEYKGGGR